jgi:hypothetical protein
MNKTFKQILAETNATLGLIDEVIVERLLRYTDDLDSLAHYVNSTNGEYGEFILDGKKLLRYSKKVSTNSDYLVQHWDVLDDKSMEITMTVKYEVFDYVENKYVYLEG